MDHTHRKVQIASLAENEVDWFTCNNSTTSGVRYVCCKAIMFTMDMSVAGEHD